MPQRKVVVYSTPTCPHCISLKEYLRKHNVKYKDIDVSQDSKALDEMVEKSGQIGVPVIVIDGKTVIVGFDRAALEKELGIQD